MNKQVNIELLDDNVKCQWQYNDGFIEKISTVGELKDFIKVANIIHAWTVEGKEVKEIIFNYSKENLDFILNYILNKAMCHKDSKIKGTPNSNKIGEFVNEHIQYLGNINLSDTNPTTMKEILNNYKIKK